MIRTSGVKMLFPNAERVIYEKNLLDQVVCRLVFPPILKIETKPPDDFQEEVRAIFSTYSKTATTEFNVIIPPGSIGSLPPELITQVSQSQGETNHEFGTDDGLWKINLTRTSISLATKEYLSWEHFMEQFMIPYNAFIKEYRPSGFLRIDLRYMDIICRSELGLEDVAWSELLEPHILGLLADREIEPSVKTFQSQYELELPNESGIMRMSMKFVRRPNEKEKCYLMDSDFFSIRKTAPGDVIQILESFHNLAWRLIQGCTTKRLQEAMKPKPFSPAN